MRQSTWKRWSPRRPAAALMAGLMTVSLLPAAAISALAVPAAEPAPDMMDVVAAAQLQENPFDFESDSDAGELEKDARSFPASFDLRHCDTDGDGVFENYVTPVKLQNPFGTCWGFGAIAAAEISLLGSGLAQADGYGPAADPDNGVKELNLSEKHLAYFTFTALSDRNDAQNGEGLRFPEGTTAAERFDNGGNTFFATSLFASGIGPNLEDRGSLDPENGPILTYRGKNGFVEYQRADVDGKGTYQLTPVWYSEKDDWSIPEQYRFYASYRLKESYELPSPAGTDEEGGYVYNQDGTNAIKEQLLEKRGVSIAFCADTSMPGQDQDKEGYISENWAHYTWQTAVANHAVCIVGWDDSYPKENFAAGHQPPADGAWLVKNSWGSAANSDFAGNGCRHWGIRDENGTATGYFWLSYYDQSLTGPEAFAFDKSNAGKGYYVEQYDYLPVGQVSEVTVSTETGMANVFRAEADSVLSQISFQTATPGTEVTYAVCLLDEGFDNPVQGSPAVTGSEICAYGGYHKVTLPESQQVELKEGQLFSVAVKERTPSGSWAYVLPQALSGEPMEELGLTAASQCVVNEKESYVYTNSAWHDMADKDFASALTGEGDLSQMDILSLLAEDGASLETVYDNFPIKAYLEPVGQVTGGDIDPDPARNAEPAYDGKLVMEIGGDQQLYPGSKTRVSARFFGKLGDVTDPAQTVAWTSSDPAVFTVGPGPDPKNDGKVTLTGVAPGTATLTADAGPYGKESVTVTVEKRTFEMVLLNKTEPVYTGEPIQPKPVFISVSKLEDEDVPKPEEGKDYRLEYKDNILCGPAQAILVGMGDYEGVEVPVDFTIVPARAEITEAVLDGDTLTVQFVSQEDSGIDGYALSWRPVGDGSGEAQTMDLAPDAVSAELTGLEPGQTYTVSLRAYVASADGAEPESEEDAGEAEMIWGEACIPAIVSTCAKDGTCPLGGFTDVSAGAWYHDGVHWALDQEVMNGVSEKSFQPGGAATRAMVVTMLWRLAGEPEAESASSFTDVKSGAWYAGAVAWAVENDIVTGYSDAVFGPNDNVTREQLAAILYRYQNGGFDPAGMMDLVMALLSLLGGDIDLEAMTEEREPLPFDDAGSVHEWAEDAVYWAWEQGILNGKTETLLAPRDNAARAEVAAMLMRTCAIIAEY